MFEKFPQTAPLLPIHKDAYDSFIEKFAPHSDLSFGTLMIWWNLNDDLEIAELNDNIVLTYTDPFAEMKRRFTLLGTNKIDESIQTIFSYQRSHGLEVGLHMTPDYTVQALKNPEGVIIEDDIDNTDYILSTKRTAELEDSTISRTRRKVRQFLREANGEVEVRGLSIHGIRDKIRLINDLHMWDDVYGTENDRGRYEGIAINRALLLSDLIGTYCLGVFVQGKLEAFALYHQPPQVNYTIVNHLKTSNHYPHLFDFVLHMLAQRLQDEGIEYMNIEQDLGIPGLRFHKEGLRPTERLKKFNVLPR